MFLYYGMAVRGTMLTALSAIASAQASPIVDTMNKTKKFLDYVATNPVTILAYRASDMVLGIHSDASYALANLNLRAGHGVISSCPTTHDPPNGQRGCPKHCTNHQSSSHAWLAELGALFTNAREAVPM